MNSPPTTAAAFDRHAGRRRIVVGGLVALGALLWLGGLAAVGFISSRPDPMVGESAQNLVFTYLLLLPAFVWLLTLRGADAGDHRNWGQIRVWASGLTASRPSTRARRLPQR